MTASQKHSCNIQFVRDTCILLQNMRLQNMTGYIFILILTFFPNRIILDFVNETGSLFDRLSGPVRVTSLPLTVIMEKPPFKTEKFLKMKKESTKNYTRGGVPLHELSPNLNFTLFIFV